MSPAIRPAGAPDTRTIAAIYAPVVTETHDTLETQPPTAAIESRVGRTADRLPWLVCEHDGAVLGYAYASPYDERPAYRWTATVSVYVDAAWRRHGVGRGLYRSLLSVLGLQGIASAVAVIALPNPASVSLHEALRFERVGVYDRVGYKDGAWRDVGHWQRPIGDRTDPPDMPTHVAALAGTDAHEATLASGESAVRISGPRPGPSVPGESRHSCRPLGNSARMGLLEHKGRARLFYRFLSVVYDRVNPFVWTEAMRANALDRFDLDRGDRVLDVGCGTGFGTEGLLQHSDDVHGLDQSVHQLRRAWAKLGKHDRVAWALGDAERLPYRDDAFDAVWSSGSIEYWPDPVSTLAECARVTRPGGAVLVVGPNAPDNPLVRRLAEAVMLFYDEAEADRMFRAAGFEEFEHVLMGPAYRPELAITTVARAPG